MCVDICQKLKGHLRENLRDAFDLDLDEFLRSRERELWILGVDSKKGRMIDVCRTIGEQQMAIINSQGFWDTDAGFRADAHRFFPTSGREVDVFLLNTEHFQKPEAFLDPLIVHELAHYLEHTGIRSDASEADKSNAAAVMVCLKNEVRAIHTPAWSQHLAVGARRMVKKGKTDARTIREFLEAAVPPYDRNGNISVRE